MLFLLVFLLTVVATTVLSPLVKKLPALWYALAAVLVALYLAQVLGSLPPALKWAVLPLMQKGTLALALFSVVMFIGALPDGSKLRRRLAPVRSELSIVACILVCGHMVAYAVSFVPRLIGMGQIGAAAAAGLMAAAVLTVLLAVLGVTSLSAVKAHMPQGKWKRIQRWAYVFYVLTYAHIVLMLLPSALAGGSNALQSLIAYTIVFASYAVARNTRAVHERASGSRKEDAG